MPTVAGEVGRRGGAQFVDLALDLVDPQPAVVDDRHAGRVVAAVLEAGQAVEHHGHGVPVPDTSHDAAHAQYRPVLALASS